MDKSKLKPFFAELIGTFALVFAVLVSLSDPNFPIPTPVIAALTLGLFVYTIGNTSGCHINPAITLAALLIKQIKPKKAVSYIVAQFCGAGLAKLLALPFLSFSAVLLTHKSSITIGFDEMIGAAFFAFGIAAVMLNNVPQSLSGLVVGGSLFLGVSLAAHGAYGLLNPAVALGTGTFSLAYVLGPVVGASIGMLVYKYLVNLRQVAAGTAVD